MNLKVSLLSFTIVFALNTIGVLSMESSSVPQTIVQTNASRLLIFGIIISAQDGTKPAVLRKIGEHLIVLSKKVFDSSGVIQMKLEITRRGYVLLHELSSDSSHNKVFSKYAGIFREIPVTLDQPAFVSVVISVDGARFPCVPLNDMDVIAYRDPQTREIKVSQLKNQSRNLTFDSSITLSNCSAAEALRCFEEAPAQQRRWQERNTNLVFELPSPNTVSPARDPTRDLRPYKDKVKAMVTPLVSNKGDEFTLRVCIRRDGSPEEVIAWSATRSDIHQNICAKIKQLHFDPIPDWYRGELLILQFGFP